MSDLPKIETLDLELIGACNFRCQMCPHTTPGRAADFLKSLPWSVFEKVILETKALGLHTVRLHGSGEPTLYRRLAHAVEFCKRQGLKVLITTNGSRLTPDLSRDLIAAGLDQLTVSATGYDRESYQRWMGSDLFYPVRDQVKFYVEHSPNVCNLYHLIIDPARIDQEVRAYQQNWIDYTGARYEIWHMHNWSGTYQSVRFQRQRPEQRSCGRMFQPVLTVRAGGLGSHNGAVVACCMVLGQDQSAVLGHLDTDSVAEVWSGARYQDLRTKHAQGQWDQIDYCRGCDQLYDRPDSLVATDLHTRVYNRVKAVDV